MELKNQQGSTLIEVIVAMILLAVVVTGLNAGVMTLINSNIASKELSAATNKGYERLEQFRNEKYEAIEIGNDIVNEKYVLVWTVTPDSKDTMKKIELTVSWPASLKHTISMATIIAKK